MYSVVVLSCCTVDPTQDLEHCLEALQIKEFGLLLFLMEMVL